jgi:hypothetical protein
MQAQTAGRLLLAALALAGCGGRGAVEINPKSEEVSSRWNARLATPAALAGAIQVQGNGWMGSDPKDSGQTRAEVEISNAAPGGVHPWHVHRGRCGQDQGIVGPADAYKPLKVGGDGKADASALLPFPVPTAGSFFVNVHASAANMGAIVACGNLAPPLR